MTFGSLFAGIGGMDLGLERAGMTCRWQVEIDPFCRKVLAKHWPNVPKYGDIREITGGELDHVDLIAGGFPCQDISYAGPGHGLSGARSGLWWEYARIVREMGPRFVLVENVPALLTRGMGDVLGTLAGYGYHCEWASIPALAVGAPHLRYRVFIVANTNHKHVDVGRSRTGEVCGQRSAAAELCRSEGDMAEADSSRESQPQGREQDKRGRIIDSSETVANTDRAGSQGRQRSVMQERTSKRAARTGGPLPRIFTERPAGVWSAEPAVGRVADGIPSRVDRLRGLGNAVVPQVAEWIGRRIMTAEMERVA